MPTSIFQFQTPISMLRWSKKQLKALNKSLFEIGNTAETETSPIAILLLLIICGKTSASVDNGTKTISDLGDLNYWTFDRRVVDISEGIPIKCENENVQLWGGWNTVFLYLTNCSKMLSHFIHSHIFSSLPHFSVVEVNLAIYMFLESIGSSVCIQYQERYIFLSSSFHLFVKYQHNLVMRMHIVLVNDH